MSRFPNPVERQDLAERYTAWIEVHLDRLARGHDLMGHLFAIERLARAARSEAHAARPSSGSESDAP